MKYFVLLCVLYMYSNALVHGEDNEDSFDPGNTLSDCLNPITQGNCDGFTSTNGFRTLDGTCNNLLHSTLGAANTPLARVLKQDYVDGYDTPRGFPGTNPIIPTAHEVSQAVFTAVNENIQQAFGLSAIFMSFGQLLSHDLSLSPAGGCRTPNCSTISAFKYPCFPIKFTRDGDTCTGFGRSKAVCQNGVKEIRNQLNSVTSYVDGSVIYGSDINVSKRLRKLDGSGELKTDENDTQPVDNQAINCRLSGGCSLVGESRADQNVALFTMHTIWLRHHNILARGLKVEHPDWNEDLIFETARKINIAVYQHVVYNEYLPHLVTLPPYKQYNPKINPSVSSDFSTAAFRLGHSLVPDSFAILNENYDKKDEPISLQNAFLNTKFIRSNRIEGCVYGLLANQSQKEDTLFAFGISRRLFVPPGQTTHADLTAVNIQRGRDHGLPTYGHYRRICKLQKLEHFSDLKGIMPAEIIEKFQQIYDNPNNIDLFAAGVAENHYNRKILGQTFQCLVKKQFQRLRDGDRYYYQNPLVFSKAQLKSIEEMSFARVLCDTLKGIVSIQKKAFITSLHVKRTVCNSIPGLNIKYW